MKNKNIIPTHYTSSFIGIGFDILKDINKKSNNNNNDKKQKKNK